MLFLLAACKPGRTRKLEKTAVKIEKDSGLKRAKTAEEILADRQRYYLRRGNEYYVDERFDDAKTMCQKVIQLGKDTEYGIQAEDLLREVNKVSR